MKLLLDDYPYAEDGLLIWNGLKTWNDGYLVRLRCSAEASTCCAADFCRSR